MSTLKKEIDFSIFGIDVTIRKAHFSTNPLCACTGTRRCWGLFFGEGLTQIDLWVLYFSTWAATPSTNRSIVIDIG